MKFTEAVQSRSASLEFDQAYYLRSIDFPDWYRYFELIKNVGRWAPARVLEVGVGNHVLERVVSQTCNQYVTIDINPHLNPTVVCDVRECRKEFAQSFDVVICSEVLEHIGIIDVPLGLSNIYTYLRQGGKAIITVPSRRKEIFFLGPRYTPHVLALPVWITPLGFYRRFMRKNLYADPNHEWELGHGKVLRSDLERMMNQVGFHILGYQKLVYVDMWTLERTK